MGFTIQIEFDKSIAIQGNTKNSMFIVLEPGYKMKQIQIFPPGLTTKAQKIMDIKILTSLI